MKLSGVQFARPIWPPARQRGPTRARRAWSGVNMTPKVESAASKLGVAEGQRFGIGGWKSTGEAFGRGSLAAPLEQGRHEVGRGHVAEAARRGQRHVAVAGRDVEHLRSGAQVSGSHNCSPTICRVVPTTA